MKTHVVIFVHLAYETIGSVHGPFTEIEAIEYSERYNESPPDPWFVPHIHSLTPPVESW